MLNMNLWFTIIKFIILNETSTIYILSMLQNFKLKKEKLYTFIFGFSGLRIRESVIYKLYCNFPVHKVFFFVTYCKFYFGEAD